MGQELAKFRAFQLGYYFNGSSPEMFCFKLFDGKSLCPLIPPILKKKVNPVDGTKEATNVVVVGASKKSKRDDLKLFAFDS